MATALTTLPRQRFLPIGPLLLIGAGLVLLLNNLGVVSWDIWRTLAAYWPVVLVLLGAQALVTGRVDWASLVGLLALAAVLSIGTRLVLPGEPRAGAGVAPTTETFRQELAGAQRATVRVSYGGGELTVGRAEGVGLLAMGELAGAGGVALVPRYGVRDGVGTLDLGLGGDAEDGHFPFFHDEEGPSRLSVGLSPSVPLDLQVEAGAAQATLDLRELQVSTLRYNTGAASSRLVLPERGVTQAMVQAGAASVTIEVPPGVAARIRTGGSGLSEVKVDEARFPKIDGGYESREYSTAANRVDSTITAGASSVRVR